MHQDQQQERKGISGQGGKSLLLLGRSQSTEEKRPVSNTSNRPRSGICSCGGPLVRNGYCFICASCGWGSCD